MKNTQLPVLTKEYQRQAAGMIRQYADKLIQMGYGFTRRQLKEMIILMCMNFLRKNPSQQHEAGIANWEEAVAKYRV